VGDQLVFSREGPQRAATDRRVVRRKLVVGAADDPAEHEADRMADEVLARLRDTKAGDSASTWVGRDTRIRRASIGAEGGAVDDGLARDISAARRGGAALPDDVQRTMGDAFGTDFRDVRVHTDAAASTLNRQLSARAFTVGRDVFFDRGQYQPQREEGRRLLAHELAHTVQQGATGTTAARTIRRWPQIPKGPAPDLNDALQVKTISSGQAVFFLEDQRGETMVVKAEPEPVGIAQLFATIHHQVSGTPSIRTRALPVSDVPKLKGLIADASKTGSATWDKLYTTQQQRIDYALQGMPQQPDVNPANLQLLGVNATPTVGRGKARLFHMEQLDQQQKLVAMTVAPGKSMADVASPQGAGGNTARALFMEPKHMEQLGMITAVDLFLLNADRMYTENLGNWFVDANRAITLIDNVDDSAAFSMQKGRVETQGKAGAKGKATPTLLTKLADGNLDATAAKCISSLIAGMGSKGGDPLADSWAAGTVGSRTRREIMEEAFLRGLKKGKAQLIKRYATKKSGTRGRGAKQAAKLTTAQDITRGDQPDEAYWDTIKARARWLKEN
jgi:hypothetical protein